MRRPRVSIGSLMGVVMVVAVGFAALRNPSRAWFGAMDMLTRGVLGLAILLAAFRRGPRRAWWVGFVLFGIGYLHLVVAHPEYGYRHPLFPTSGLLEAMKSYFGHAPTPTPAPTDDTWRDYFYLASGHDLWAMAAAFLGGVLGWLVFARSVDSTGPPEIPAPADERPSRVRWIRPTIIGWTCLVLATSAAAIRTEWDAGFWAGATFLLTLGLLALAGLGAICRRGRRRLAWLGAGLLGNGYLFLVFSHNPLLPIPTGQLLDALRDHIPRARQPGRARQQPDLPGAGAADPDEVPQIPRASWTFWRMSRRRQRPRPSPASRSISTPSASAEAEQSVDSTVTIDSQDLPLKTTLRLCLWQLELEYAVRDGYLWVTARDETDISFEDPFHASINNSYGGASLTRADLSADLRDPYLIVGHCLLALLAAGFGAVAAPALAGAGRDPGFESRQ